MLKSWKTSLAGLISLIVGAVAASHDTSFVAAAQDFNVQMAVIAGIGLMLAKDGQVTGGTVGQPSTPQALADANQHPSAINEPVGPPPVVKSQ